MDEKDHNITRTIREKAYEIICQHPEGIRYSELVDLLIKKFPTYNHKTIFAQVSELRKHKDYVDKIEQIPRIYKASKPCKNSSSNGKDTYGSRLNQKSKGEKKFYEPFAIFLRDELNECTVARPIEEEMKKQKWANPDVIGYHKVGTTSSFQMRPKLVAGELKVDTEYRELITGFGQAVSYLLFCHKSYLAIPSDASHDDIRKIESLCIKFGIGLLTFNRQDSEKPDFKVRNRAKEYEPDITYLNDLGADMVDYLESESRQ